MTRQEATRGWSFHPVWPPPSLGSSCGICRLGAWPNHDSISLQDPGNPTLSDASSRTPPRGRRLRVHPERFLACSPSRGRVLGGESAIPSLTPEEASG